MRPTESMEGGYQAINVTWINNGRKKTPLRNHIAGLLACGTCHKSAPSKYFIGRWGKYVSECEDCREVRKLKSSQHPSA